MTVFWPPPSLVALPTEPHSTWLQAHIELLLFERMHYREHPRCGTVVVCATPDERTTYLRLLDDERRAYDEMTAGLSTPVQPPEAKESLSPCALECPF